MGLDTVKFTQIIMHLRVYISGGLVKKKKKRNKKEKEGLIYIDCYDELDNVLKRRIFFKRLEALLFFDIKLTEHVCFNCKTYFFF